MRNIALKLMYNGTAYHGWQVQKNAVTVCETLQKAIEKITRHLVYMFSTVEWYFSIQICEIHKDCRVPDFFHDRGYWTLSIEHNNGDWDARKSYELFIVE